MRSGHPVRFATRRAGAEPAADQDLSVWRMPELGQAAPRGSRSSTFLHDPSNDTVRPSRGPQRSLEGEDGSGRLPSTQALR